ncbi:MAG TPA: type II CAAX endopeptidase family protein [Candidatus Acidoferrum sp.]|nr:type II CAAX endopeptidase family protein [Candidatus Acidoferrum sp.]
MRPGDEQSEVPSNGGSGADSGRDRRPEPAAQREVQFDVPLAGDPISLAAITPRLRSPNDTHLPDDLRISWSWAHLIVFLAFSGVSLVAIQAGFWVYYAPLHRAVGEKEFARFVLSRPFFAVGSMVAWYATLLLFLYVTLSVLRGFPFWKTLGWRSLRSDDGKPRSAWLYFLGGCGLSIVVFLATAKVQPKQDVPIEELFHYKNTAFLFMAMAVLIAPLVEETVFRGYLYPLLARSFGVATGVIVTGVLFGLMHGAQLGWTWGLVFVLMVVGVVFTLARARTGSVFASFLLHLGYNSMIAFVTILGTQGFTKIPPMH